MERRRLQHQRMKQQQHFCVSQQDLTEAITRMKSCRVTHESLTDIPSETLNSRSVSQLIQEFEARTQDLLPINNDIIANRVEPNCSHMFIQTMKIKGNSNDNDIINNNVCSPISSFINDDNQMVTVDLHRHHLTDDKEQEKKGEEIHKQDLPSSSIYNTENKNNNHHQYPTPMLTRCTDIDAAALTFGKRYEIHFDDDDLVTKETQFDNALVDLLSISNDGDQSSSINSSSGSVTTYNPKNDDNHVKPINMFW